MKRYHTNKRRPVDEATINIVLFVALFTLAGEFGLFLYVLGGLIYRAFV